MPGIFIDPDDLCFYVTEACNSNCIMCPMSNASRKRGNTMSDEEWDRASNIPEGTEHITITGGEPFLEYKKVIPLMKSINEKVPWLPVLILTNGRALSIPFIQDQLSEVITDRYHFAIPVHASTAELHDCITQTPGSFDQTLKGLQYLSSTSAKIEIRIVGHKKNLKYLNDTFKVMSDLHYNISLINLIAMEMTGSAARNRDDLWVDYQEVYKNSEEGIRYAVYHNIDVGLYNFPFCTIPRNSWQLAKDSITRWKIRYEEDCSHCILKNTCGGLFYSVKELGLCKISPIKEAGSC